MSRQVGARLRCFPLNGELPFWRMIEDTWKFMKLMGSKPDGFDFGDWEVKYFNWQYAEDGVVIPIPGDEGLIVIAPMVLVQRGVILWREWRLLESQVEGGFLKIGDGDTAHVLKREAVCLGRFVTVMMAVQAFRARFNEKVGLDGEVIQYEYLDVSELRTKVTFHKPRAVGSSVIVKHVVPLKISDVFAKLEQKFEARKLWVDGQMAEYGLAVDFRAPSPDLEKMRKSFVSEINVCVRTWLRWPVNVMLQIPSHLIENYSNGQYVSRRGVVNEGAGPSSWSLREE